jgi:phosphoserine phosphatase
MLEAVGDPVVVGADPALRDVGAQRGWRSIDTDAARVTGS